jgi:predicted nucleic acid-binding protein
MRETIISDTSSLLAFHEIGELSILQRMYGEITTTSAVQREYEYPFPAWIVVREPLAEYVQCVQQRFKLDPGEVTAIALALTLPKSVLVIDEAAGRRAAHELGIQITGTLGILLKAKKRGIIAAVRPLIRKLQAINFRISEPLITAILTEADEI